MLTYLGIRLTARCRTERGASAVEYGLLVFAVALGLYGITKVLGLTLVAEFKHQNSIVEGP